MKNLARCGCKMWLKCVKNFVRYMLEIFLSVNFVRVPLRLASKLGLLPCMIWRRLPVVATFLVSVGSSNKFFKYNSSCGDAIGRSLYWTGGGGREPETIDIFSRLSKRSKLFIDIGANTGHYSLYACAVNPEIHVIAFEPVPRIYKRLQANIELNCWQGRCVCKNASVSNYMGVAKFHVPHSSLPTSASLDLKGFHNIPGKIIEVPVTNIDSVLTEGESPDLVKIDVEGFEDKVLEGMTNTLKLSKPCLIVECNPDGPYKLVEMILVDFGYRFFRLHKNGPIPMGKILPDSNENFRNWLCLTESRLSWINK